MATIKCPECGAMVSETATSCPQCGFRKEEKCYRCGKKNNVFRENCEYCEFPIHNNEMLKKEEFSSDEKKKKRKFWSFISFILITISFVFFARAMDAQMQITDITDTIANIEKHIDQNKDSSMLTLLMVKENLLKENLSDLQSLQVVCSIISVLSIICEGISIYRFSYYRNKKRVVRYVNGKQDGE